MTTSIRLVPNRRFPSIPAVSEDVRNHTLVLQAVKEAVEVGKRDTADVLNSYVRVKDLVDMGFATLESGLLVPEEFAGTGATTPGGSDTEVQFNNAGVLDGAPNVTIASDHLRVADYFELSANAGFPTAPAASSALARVFGVPMGNATIPAFRMEAGGPFFMLNSQFGKRAKWCRIQTGTSFDSMGITGMSGTGTGSTISRTPSATTTLGQITRRSSTSTVATNATASQGANSFAADTGHYVSCSGTTKAGGFFAHLRGGWATIRSDQRLFMGMHTLVSFTGDPSARVDLIGIGADQADTDLQLMVNDGSGTATKVGLGVAKTAFAGHLLDLYIYVPSGGGSCTVLLHDREDGTTYQPATQVTDLPTADVVLNFVIWANTGTTTTTAVIAALHSFMSVENF